MILELGASFKSKRTDIREKEGVDNWVGNFLVFDESVAINHQVTRLR